VHHGPHLNHLVIDGVSNCGRVDLPAECHKEDMSIDNEDINDNAHLLLELK
jgi:hypothetical protein